MAILDNDELLFRDRFSLAHAEEALVSALPFIESIPAAQDYARLALQVAEAWGLDTHEFLNQAIRVTQDDKE